MTDKFFGGVRGKNAVNPNLRKVPIDSIQQGPVRHELTGTQTERLKLVYDVCGHLTCDTLEEFELGFMRDAVPDDEIRVWERITVAFHKAMKRYPDEMSKDEATNIVQSFILISCSGPDASITVPVEEQDWIRECWRNPVE